LPIGSDPPGCLDPEADPLFFQLCDDLPNGELEQALTLLHPIPPERRRVLAVLADQSDRQRLQRLQEAGVDGLCTHGSCGQGGTYTAMDVIPAAARTSIPCSASGCWNRLVLGRCAASMT
jgi:hypothetical protein